MKKIILIASILSMSLFAESCNKPFAPNNSATQLQMSLYIAHSNSYEQCKTRNLIEKQMKQTKETNKLLNKLLQRG